MQFKHTARSKDWRKVESRKYPRGTRVSWKDKHTKEIRFGIVLYRYVTFNRGFINPATAILDSNGKVCTTQATLKKEV